MSIEVQHALTVGPEGLTITGPLGKVILTIEDEVAFIKAAEQARLEWRTTKQPATRAFDTQRDLQPQVA